MSVIFFKDVSVVSSNSLSVTGGTTSWTGLSIGANGTTLSINSLGFFLTVTSTSGSAPANSIFFCSETSKLTYKDSNNTANALY